MSISYDPKRKTLTLATKNTTYQMGVGPVGHLLHLYYGRRAEGSFGHLYPPHDCGFSPNPYELRDERGWSPDTMPQEYSGSDTGDFRLPCLEIAAEDGVRGADLRYVRHEIRPGKYGLPGLPASFDREGEAETLAVTLSDPAAGVEVELLYGVFAARDVITRAARIVNVSTRAVRLEKAASMCLDIPFGTWDLLHFHGRHTMERQPERTCLSHGVQSVGSRRGASSHQHDPFVILCGRDAAEDAGECYGLMSVYSGSFETDVELDQMNALRAVAGIRHDGFSWTLEPGEAFFTPEVILSFTDGGFTALSHTYHRFLRRNICRSPWTERPRPILLNSWEAAYFDFDADKLLSIARGAKALGAELFVLDDGWFGVRNSDSSGLGDWFANEKKLPGGLAPLIREMGRLGLRFGLWVEPEMVSEDSELYRAHPDWALTVPGRKPVLGREQLVLDLSRPEVADWLYDTIAGLLTDYDISYIKWDMNRSLTDLYSRGLPPDRQGEVGHRYMLGLYGVLERLTASFPHVLFEGCAGGGGRFDAGMLAYFPQIWCSDNTDPIARLAIQHGTSFGYPMSAVSAHVSASPNHQTGRTTPLGTRGLAAMGGGFGYELDPGALTPEEAEEIRRQIARCREYGDIVLTGDLYRLTVPGKGPFTAWQTVSEDGARSILCAVVTEPAGNPLPMHVRLKGLDPAGRYAVTDLDVFGSRETGAWLPEEEYTGAALMYGGVTLPSLKGDYPSAALYLERRD